METNLSRTARGPTGGIIKNITMNLRTILVSATMVTLVVAAPSTDKEFETEPTPKIEIGATHKEETEIHEIQAAKENGQTGEEGDIQIVLEDDYIPEEEYLPQIGKDFEVDYLDPSSVPMSPYNFYQNSMISPFAEDEEMMERAANIAAAFSIYKRRKHRRGYPRQAQRRYSVKKPHNRRFGYYYPFYPIYYRRFPY